MSTPPSPSQQQPQSPVGWGGPGGQPQWGPPPQPPKKFGVGKIIGFGCLGVIALFIVLGAIGAAVSGGSDSTDSNNKDKAISTAGSKPKADHSQKAPAKKAPAEEKPAEKNKSQAEQFQACVAKTGTPTEKAAVKHVTKVTGADKRNNILDSAEVWTDFTGGFMSDNAGDAKLIGSAFTSCYESDNGLVTVYGKDGDLIATANY